MPGNYGHTGGNTGRATLWEQLPFGGKRKFSEEDANLSGPSTSTGVGESYGTGKRHCLHGALEQGRHMEPSTSMDFDEDTVGTGQIAAVYPTTLYSHMVPYAGTPPAARASSRPEFPRPDAISPLYSNLTRDQAAQLILAKREESASRNCSPFRATQTAFCQEHCRKGTESPNSAFVRCFCRPSWEGMIKVVPMENDYY